MNTTYLEQPWKIINEKIVKRSEEKKSIKLQTVATSAVRCPEKRK